MTRLMKLSKRSGVGLQLLVFGLDGRAFEHGGIHLGEHVLDKRAMASVQLFVIVMNEPCKSTIGSPLP